MKKTFFFLLSLASIHLYAAYPDQAIYGDGKTRTHKDMLDSYMAGLKALSEENDPTKNNSYLNNKKATISYGKAYWLGAKDETERAQREAYLLKLKAPTHLERHQAYHDKPLAPDHIFIQGLFDTWRTYLK